MFFLFNLLNVQACPDVKLDYLNISLNVIYMHTVIFHLHVFYIIIITPFSSLKYIYMFFTPQTKMRIIETAVPLRFVY